MYRESKSPADHLPLQDDINKLHEWAERWQMNFNVTKCALMSLSSRKVLQHAYIINAQLIPQVQKHDYLGVTISSSLRWKDQYTKVGNKAKRTLGLVKGTLHAIDRSVRKTAYEMLIRTPLECATCAWSPHTLVSTYPEGQTVENRFVCSECE